MKLYTVEEAREVTLQALRAREADEVLVVCTTTGTGKSHVTQEYIAEEARAGRKFCMSATNHKLLRELEERYRDLTAKRWGAPAAVRYHRGLTSDVASKAACKLPLAKVAAAHGVNVGEEICRTCPHRRGCDVRAELAEAAKSDASLSLCPREMVPMVCAPKKLTKAEAAAAGNEYSEAPTLFVDEETSAFEHDHITPADLAAEHDLTYLNPQILHVFNIMLDSRRAGRLEDEVARRWAQGFDPRKHARLGEGLGRDGMEHEPTRRALRVFAWLLLGYGPGGSFGPGEEGRLPATGPNPVLALLLRFGGVVLTATPNRPMWRALKAQGHKVQLLELDVKDAQPTQRVWLSRSDASKTKLLPKDPSEADWNGLLTRLFVRDHDLHSLLKHAPSWGTRLLIVTHKVIADEIGDKDVLLAALRPFLPTLQEVDVAYYKGTAGLDRWRDFNMCITIGDFYPSREEQQDLARVMGVELDSDAHKEACREYGQAETIQAHGRLRAPRRDAPLWLGHVGYYDPGWHGRTVDTVGMKKGKKPKPRERCPSGEEVAREVERVGGPSKAARILGGRSKGWITNCAKGRRDMDRADYEKLLAAPAALSSDMAGLARAVDQGVVRRLSSRPPPPPTSNVA